MKTIIAGSRTITRHGLVRAAIVASGWADAITEVVSGAAKGVDRIGEQWAREKGVHVRRFPADWRTHGKAAGPIRNDQMAAYADALIAVWDGQSRGTKHMIDTAQRQGLQIYVHTEEQDDLFTERTLECQGCGATFTTTNPRASDRCVECKAGLKVKVVCPVCDLIHAVALLAPHKLCLSCSADTTMTLASARVRLEDAQSAADSLSAQLDADVAHADDATRSRFEAAVGMLVTGQLGDRQLTTEQVHAAWAKALAKGDDLSPLLALYDAAAAAAAAALTQQRAVRAATEAMEHTKEII